MSIEHEGQTADPDRACGHEAFHAQVSVQRLVAEEDGPVTGFVAEVWLRCRSCDESFVWSVPNIGLSTHEARTDVSGTELRVHCRPASYPEDWSHQTPNVGFVFRDGGGS